MPETPLQAGQELWFAPKSRGGGIARWLTIERVGRHWAYSTMRHRINVHTLEVNEPKFGCVGQCYLRREDHDAEQALKLAWFQFRLEVNRHLSVPERVTPEVLIQVQQLLWGDPK